MKYFKFGMTEEELKKEYKKLVKKLHPDNGGNEESFKTMQNEFDKYNSMNEKEHESNNNEDYRKAFRTVMDIIINYDINIEICGSWIWVDGKTYDIKDILKTSGFNWASSKKRWFWNNGEEKQKTRYTQDMEKIRLKYGSEMIKGIKKEGLRLAV